MSALATLTGAWGLLPLAVPALMFVAARLGSLAFPENAAHRALGGAVLALALVVADVSLLGAVRLFTPTTAAVSLGIVTVALVLVQRERRFAFPFRAALSLEVLPMLLVALAALGSAVLVARWLPIWAWDSLAYHLPYVNFFTMGHGQAGVPSDVPYLSTYPHNVELFTVAMRAMLPDDRLVDLAQVPLGVLGAMAVAGIARMHGAERPHALAAGCAWIVIPAVFMELPTNYVDVGSAAFYLAAVYFVLAAPTPRSIALAGLALGLFLGSKPSAPLAAAVLGLLLVVRGARAKLVGPTLVAIALATAFGVSSYVSNLVRHGNPTWPVAIDVGPLHLPGTVSLKQVLDPSPDLSPTLGPLPVRMVQSWFNLTHLAAYDVRVGGYGPLFLVALPFALWGLVRARNVTLVVALLAIFANPYPTWARFVLPFPGLVLALAAPQLSRLSRLSRGSCGSRLSTLRMTIRPVILAACSVVGIAQMAYAWPGILAAGPFGGASSLWAYARMTDPERANSIPISCPNALYQGARERIGEHETFAYDRTDTAYLSWEPDLRYRVVFIPKDLTPDRVGELLEREHVRVFSVEDDSAGAQWVRAHADRVARLFACPWNPCAVYERLPP
ncbi:hypothetical protein [Pendulispora albinea]|uniref:DUF2079 domain-containing protein n=1 Tax=Pendulispora albinea TaxID=2741071 RepID=A0ABZ2M5G0_9BACT